ncbi:MAG: DUF928 domain-containing protein [Cyanobacteria bacterium P01_G01_bin.54]
MRLASVVILFCLLVSEPLLAAEADELLGIQGRGISRRKIATGSRGEFCEDDARQDSPEAMEEEVIVIVPEYEDNEGEVHTIAYTQEPQFNIYISVPAFEDKQVYLQIINQNRRDAGAREFRSQLFSLVNSRHIARIVIPETFQIPILSNEENPRAYKWELYIQCDPNDLTQDVPISSGLVYRVAAEQVEDVPHLWHEQMELWFAEHLTDSAIWTQGSRSVPDTWTQGLRSVGLEELSSLSIQTYLLEGISPQAQ